MRFDGLGTWIRTRCGVEARHAYSESAVLHCLVLWGGDSAVSRRSLLSASSSHMHKLLAAGFQPPSQRLFPRLGKPESYGWSGMCHHWHECQQRGVKGYQEGVEGWRGAQIGLSEQPGPHLDMIPSGIGCVCVPVKCCDRNWLTSPFAAQHQPPQRD